MPARNSLTWSGVRSNTHKGSSSVPILDQVGLDRESRVQRMLL